METCSVLVVEDDADCAEVLAEALRTWGHEVVIAPDASGLRRQLALWRPDVVLVDGHLGESDGIELIAELRKGPLAGVPVFLTTGRDRDEVARAASSAGIERILIKPLDLAALSEAVEAATTGRRKLPPPSGGEQAL